MAAEWRTAHWPRRPAPTSGRFPVAGGCAFAVGLVHHEIESAPRRRSEPPPQACSKAPSCALRPPPRTSPCNASAARLAALARTTRSAGRAPLQRPQAGGIPPEYPRGSGVHPSRWRGSLLGLVEWIRHCRGHGHRSRWRRRRRSRRERHESRIQERENPPEHTDHPLPHSFHATARRFARSGRAGPRGLRLTGRTSRMSRPGPFRQDPPRRA